MKNKKIHVSKSVISQEYLFTYIYTFYHNNPRYWDRRFRSNCKPKSDATESGSTLFASQSSSVLTHQHLFRFKDKYDKELTQVLLNLDIYLAFANSVDPDQLASTSALFVIQYVNL